MRSGKGTARARAALVGAALLVAPPGLPPAQAAPRGERVVSGTVGIQREGPLTQITASDGAIIEFDALDVLAHETLQFLQPSEAARVLNRVLGPDATRIDGSLLANGQVYIVNPAGVFFGGSAVVDVGRLVAAAGHLSDEDFAAGVDRFTALAGAVDNRGTIRADAVDLVGRSVANHGSVIAPEGMIAMVAGERVLLGSLDGRVLIQVEGPARDPGDWGVENSGLLDAGRGEVHLAAGDVYSLAANHTGITRGRHVRIAGGAGGLVEVAGAVDASNPDPGATGGSVEILGDRVSVRGALVDASGDAGGGAIRIGGDFQGGGDLPTARRTQVGADAELRADALSEGDGGRVIVWADEATGFHGEIRARGGEGGGDGGFAEVSGEELLVYRGRVDLRAPAGGTGTLLLDPENITIVDGSGGADDALLPDVLADDLPSPGTATLSETALESQDANILLEATNDVAIEELVTDGTLALSQALTITADADGDGAGSFSMFDGDRDGDGVLDDVPDEIVTGGADVTITGASLRVGTLDTSGTAGGDGGDIELDADGDPAEPGAPILTVTGALLARGGDAAAPGDGGDGGAVVVQADGGSLAIGSEAGISIDTRGGTAHASEGTGGDGGAVSLTAIGTPAFSDVEPGDGVGAIPAERADVTVAGDILAGGGQGCTDDDCAGDGGWGAVFAGASSGVFVTTNVGSIALGSIDTSGGAGQEGGVGGGIVLQSQGTPPLPDVEPDIDGSVPVERGDIAVGDLVATGGSGADLDGGDGGVVEVQAQIGGIAIASIDASGGASTAASGGDAGPVTLDAQGVAATPATFTRSDDDPNQTDPVRSGTPAVEVALTVAGDVRATGGVSAAASGSGASGGRGGTVQAGVGVGSLLQVASIFTSGGDGPTGGSAGTISLLAEGAAAVAPVIDPGDGGALAPVVTAEGTDAVTVLLKATGDLLARGGASSDAEAEFGGLGGPVQVTSLVGSVEVGAPEAPSRIETDGGAGTIEGGSAGTIVLFAEGQEAVADSDPGDGIDDSIAHVPADVTLGASLSALGGDAPEGVRGGDGGVVVFADDTLRGQVGVDQDLFLQASAIGDSVDPSGRLRIEKGDRADTTLTVTADGAVGIDVTQGNFATFDLIQRDAGGGVVFTQTGGDVIEIDGVASTIEEIQEEGQIFDVVTPGRSTVVRAITGAGREWSYRLEDTLLERQPDGGEAETVSALLEVAPGALEIDGSAEVSNRGDVILGADSAQVGSDAFLAITADGDGDGDGSIVAQGAAPHIRTDGDLRLEGIGIGAEQPLTIVERGEAGEAPEVDNTLTLAAAGPVGIAVVDRAAFDVIAVTQRDAGSGVAIAQAGGDAIAGVALPEGGVLEITADTTGNDVALDFRLDDAGPEGGEAPDLVIGSATLGGDTRLASAGDIRVGGGSPIVTTEAGLILEAGGAVGSEGAPIRKQGGGGVAGSAADGGFFLSNDAGDLRIAEVPVPGAVGDASVAGIAASGEVALTSDTGPIVLADGVDGPHVTSGGVQTYTAPEVVLESDATLESGGGASFAAPVIGDASLTVDSAGTTEFTGDVELASLSTDGRGSTRIATASVTTTGSQSFGDAVVLALAQDTTFTAGDTVTFGSTLEGPGGAIVEGPGRVTFGGDVGRRVPLAGLTVHDTPGPPDAAAIEFADAEVVRTGSGGIRLNPQSRSGVPPIATIYQRDGSLSFETDGAFEVGHREKLSVAGDLAITAASVRLGDANALSLAVDADDVRIMPRAPGAVLRADGSTVTDEGTAVIANQMVFTSTPVIDPDPAFASEDNGVVTLASQSGAVRTPGPNLDAFEVRLIDERGTALQAADFVNGEGVVLDFVATGPAAALDPATALPRPLPETRQLTRPRFGTDAAVAAGLRPTLDEMRAFLSCADVAGAPAPACLAPVAGRDGQDLARFAPGLATPRARTAAARYRLLMGSDERSRQLRAAYDRAVDEYRRTRWFGAIEGAAFYAYLAGEPEHAAARAAIDQLATLFVELQLLDLAPADLQQLREIVARRFLERVHPGGLDAAALLDAVGASRIGPPGGA